MLLFRIFTISCMTSFFSFCFLTISISGPSSIARPTSFCSLLLSSSTFIFSVNCAFSVLITLPFFSTSASGIVLILLSTLIQHWQVSTTCFSFLVQPLHLLISVFKSLSLLCICQCSISNFFFFFLTIFPNCLSSCAPYTIHSFFLLSFDNCFHLTFIACVLYSSVLKSSLTSLFSAFSSILASTSLNHSAFFLLLDWFW